MRTCRESADRRAFFFCVCVREPRFCGFKGKPKGKPKFFGGSPTKNKGTTKHVVLCTFFLQSVGPRSSPFSASGQCSNFTCFGSLKKLIHMPWPQAAAMSTYCTRIRNLGGYWQLFQYVMNIIYIYIYREREFPLGSLPQKRHRHKSHSLVAEASRGGRSGQFLLT